MRSLTSTISPLLVLSIVVTLSGIAASITHALSRNEVRAEFTAGREAFGVERSPVSQREEVATTLSNVAAAWGVGDFEEVRAMLAKSLTDATIPTHYRSQLHLRIAQSHAAEGDPEAARAECLAIAAKTRNTRKCAVTKPVNGCANWSARLPINLAKAEFNRQPLHQSDRT